MPKATSPSGKLEEISKCRILTKFGEVVMNNLPDISDSKSAVYNEDPVIGRSSPMPTFSHSDARTISWKINFIATKQDELQKNIQKLRWLQACVYPQDESTGGAPYAPPPIVKVECGKLLSESQPLCAVIKRCSVSFPTEVSWDAKSYIPYKFTADVELMVVYESSELPGAERISRSGR